MKKNLTIFFQTFVLILGLGVLAFMLTMPHFEGRNVNATAFEVYFNDPFLAFAYIGSVPFFVGLYQVFNALSLFRSDKLTPITAAKALRILKYCALIIIGFVIVAEIYIIFGINDDDRAGGIAMGVFIAVSSALVALSAYMLESKSKKYLT